MALNESVSALLRDYSIPLTRAEFRGSTEWRALEKKGIDNLFPGARDAQAAWSGLLLLLGEWERSHEISQDNSSPEGSYWHAIVHRQEPDAWNSGYWFDRVGKHPIYPALCAEALTLGVDFGTVWDPKAFIEYCERARTRHGSDEKRKALEVQCAEWQLLFDWCARNP